MTFDEAKASLDLLFSGPPEVGNDRIRIWAAEVAAGEVVEEQPVTVDSDNRFVLGETVAWVRVTLKSGYVLAVMDSLRGTK